MNTIVNLLANNNQRLHTINLSRNDKIRTYFESVNDNEIKLFPNIKDLDLSECNLGDKAIKAFGTMLSTKPEDNPRKLILRISSNPIGSTGAGSLFSCLRDDSISELYLSNCEIGDEGLDHLVNGKLEGLEILDLSSNNIGHSSLTKLAAALDDGSISLTKLKELNLADNKFDNESTQSLARCLGKLQAEGAIQLEKVDMSGTSCGMTGASDLISLCRLYDLRLFNNNLESEGFLSVAKTLRGGHPTLQYLDLGGNHADEASVVSLLHALTMKSEAEFTNKLNTLVIGGNKGGPAIEDMVEQVHEIFPVMDIARDKAKQLNQHNSFQELSAKLQLSSVQEARE
jgi:hypothetical protein